MAKNKKDKKNEKVMKERKELIWLALLLTLIGLTEILTGVKILYAPRLTLWEALGLYIAAICNIAEEVTALWGFKTIIENID